MDRPRWILKKNQKRKSIKHEKRVADIVDGNRTIGSGIFHHKKGDVYAGDYFLECKITERKSYALNMRVLRKLEQEAKKQDKIPVLFVTLRDGRQTNDYVVLRTKDFLEMKI